MSGWGNAALQTRLRLDEMDSKRKGGTFAGVASRSHEASPFAWSSTSLFPLPFVDNGSNPNLLSFHYDWLKRMFGHI
jgi:hypothetical protein